MEVVVYGTNDGYRILYATNDDLARIIARDIRKGAQGDSQLGQTAYSLAFLANGYVFTKFVIVKDSLRSFATGTIAFSLFIGPDATMKAEDILGVLNELYSFYESKYIRNHYLNKGEIILIKEDWTFVPDVVSRYKPEHISRRLQEINSGTADPAFVYYSDEIDLQKYFDAPCQEEYGPFRQVFFLKSDLKDKPENPLNALRHDPTADLTGKIDLNKYTLFFSKNAKFGLHIDVKDKISDQSLLSNSRIRRKDKLQITWKKKFYKPKMIIGTLEEIGIEFITIDHIKREIIINDEISLEPITHTFKIKTQNSKGDKLFNAEITVKVGYGTEQKLENDEIKLTEEEMQNRCTVYAKIGNNFRSERREISIADKEMDIVLTLHEYKIVEFDINNENGEDIEAKIIVQDKRNVEIIGNNKIEFIDDAINSPCSIKISATGYEKWKDTFYPNNKNDAISITLNKSKKSWISRKENRLKVISVSLLCLVFAVWRLVSIYSNDPTPLASTLETKIIKYIEGDSLLAPKLNTYKREWQNQVPKINEPGAGILGIFIRNRKQPDSTTFNKWNKTTQNIDEAIDKRKLIDAKNFAELQSSTFSVKEPLLSAITKIDSSKYEEISQRLGDVSQLTLTQIADSINAIIGQQPVVNEALNISAEQPSLQETTSAKKTTSRSQEVPKTSPAPKTPTPPTAPSPTTTDNNSEIVRYLERPDLKKAKLAEYKEETTDPELKKSIDLALKFWNLDGKQGNSYSSYNEELGNDKYLKNSELKKIVKEHYKEKDPKYPNKIGDRQEKSLKELNDLIKEQ